MPLTDEQLAAAVYEPQHADLRVQARLLVLAEAKQRDVKDALATEHRILLRLLRERLEPPPPPKPPPALRTKAPVAFRPVELPELMAVDLNTVGPRRRLLLP